MKTGIIFHFEVSQNKIKNLVTNNMTNPIPTVGEKVNDYELLREIGRGGMAIIFEAKHLPSGAHHALKIMSKSKSNEEMAHRFEQEYLALSSLDHENVLKVYERGEINDRPYFSMDLLDGVILKEAVAKWADLPPTQRFEKATDILIQTTRALDHIHQLGWVHRDVTPANIMILSDGTVKLMDFGVVKMPGHELTVVGEVIGTAAYISPEQIKGEVVDSRADLYALGTALYLMLTGRGPFNARTLAGYLDKHLRKEPDPPHVHAPMAPKRLERACLRLLKKDPEKRFASANHLLRYLNATATLTPDRLIGRTWEISQVRDRLAALENGKSGVLCFESEGGMGASSLLKEAAKLAQQVDFECIFCRNRSQDQPTFIGFKPIFEELTSIDERQDLLRAFFGAVEQRFEKWRAYGIFKSMIEQAGTKVIIMEDLERSDQGTLELLEYMIRNLSEAPILFILSFRPTDRASVMDLVQGKSTEVETQHIKLQSISSAAVEEWLLCHSAPDDKIPLLAERIHRESKGKPYLIHEMIKDLIAKQKINSARHSVLQMSHDEIQSIVLALPHTLKESAKAELAELKSNSMVLLLMLSLSRERLSIDEIQNICCHLPIENRIRQDNIQAALNELTEKNMIDIKPFDGDETYEPKHYWLRDLIIEESDSVIKQSCHGALGLSMELRNRSSIHLVVEHLAHHFEHSSMFGKAFSYLFEAAKKLKRRSLIVTSMKYLDRALSIEPMARRHLTLAEAEYRLATLLLERSTVSNILGNREMAREQAVAADSHAIDLQDHQLLTMIATERARQSRES